MTAFLPWVGWALATVAVARACFRQEERRGLSYATSALASLCLASLLLFTVDQAFGLALTDASHLAAFGLTALLAGAASKLKHTPDQLTAAPAAAWEPPDVLLFGAFAFVFAVSTGWKLAAPFDDWDAFTYHLKLAREVQAGHFPSHFGRSFLLEYEAAFPPLLYHLDALVLAIAPAMWWPAGLKVLLAALHTVTCWYGWGLARHRFGLSRAASWGAVALIALRLPAAANQPFQEPSISLLVTVYLLAALYHGWSLLLDDGGVRRANLALVTVLFFGTYWSSYIGMVLVPGILGAAVVVRLLRKEPLGHSRDAVAVGLGVLGLMVPHLVRNAVAVGNPLYPALLKQLRGKDITDWFLQYRPPTARPVRMPLSGMHFVLQAGAPVSHLLLAALAALGFSDGKVVARRAFWGLWLGGFLAVWMVAFQFEETPTWRYLFPLWPVGAVLLAAALDRAGWQTRGVMALIGLVAMSLYAQRKSETLPAWQFWLSAALIFGLAAAARRLAARDAFSAWGALPLGLLGLGAWATLTFPQGVRALAGREAVVAIIVTVAAVELRGRIANLNWPVRAGAGAALIALLIGLRFDPGTLRALWGHPVLTRDVPWLNAHLGKTDRILLFEPRTAALDVPWVPADGLVAEPFVKSLSKEEGYAALRAAGITHVYASHTYEWETLDLRVDQLAADRALTEVVYRRDGSVVLKLKEPATSPPAPGPQTPGPP